MNEKISQTWTAHKLIEINQRSNVARGFIELLTDERGKEIPEEQKQEIIIRVTSEIEAIYEITQWLRIWGMQNTKDSDSK